MKIMREINVKKCQILDMYAAFMQWGYNSKNKFWIQRPLNNTVMIFKQWCTGVCKYHTRLWKYADNFKAAMHNFETRMGAVVVVIAW
jgi:hypothetical protein